MKKYSVTFSYHDHNGKLTNKRIDYRAKDSDDAIRLGVKKSADFASRNGSTASEGLCYGKIVIKQKKFFGEKVITQLD